MAQRRRVVQVNVKLAGEGRDDPPRVLRGLPGVERVTQTFPDESDEELAALYLLDVATASAEGVLERLRSDPGVEYAEKAAARRVKPRRPAGATRGAKPVGKGRARTRGR